MRLRRGATLSLALILGFAGALNAAPLLAMQGGCERERTVGEFTYRLDCDSDFELGLAVADVTGQGSAGVDRLYAVRFDGEPEQTVPNPELGAFIPERYSEQAMVVKVLTGTFAFRTQGPGVVVAPWDNTLDMYFANIPIEEGSDPQLREPEDVEKPREFTADGTFDCEATPGGHAVCHLDDPTIFDDGFTFVRLDAGDTVYFPDQSTCFLCNSERSDPDEGPAEVLIWTPPDGLDGGLQEAIVLTSPETLETLGPREMQESGRTLGWMFNPGSRCN
jgi:hypothetical protein